MRFTASRRQQRDAMISVAFIGTIACVSGAAIAISAPNPLLAMSVPVLCLLGFTGLEAFLLLYYRRHELTIDDAGVRSRNIRRERSLRWDEMSSAQWMLAPGGRLVLNSADRRRRIVIEFGTYPTADRIRAVRELRGRLADARQSGWTPFADRCMPRPKVRPAVYDLLREPLLGGILGAVACIAITTGANIHGGLGWSWPRVLGVAFAPAAVWGVIILVYAGAALGFGRFGWNNDK